jgi:hypothetical protein
LDEYVRSASHPLLKEKSSEKREGFLSSEGVRHKKKKKSCVKLQKEKMKSVPGEDVILNQVLLY